MKKTFLKLIPLLAILLGGCTPKIDNSHYSSNNTSSENTSINPSSSDNHSSSEEQGSSSEEQGSSSEEQGSSSQEQGSSEEGGGDTTKTITVWSTNDIHGQVYESGNLPGAGKFFTYLKEKRENPDTLLIDQGDTWQGSVYSNYNRGALLTDCMNYIHYDARTVGNHDFDWGLDPLRANKTRSYQGYIVPTLGGNVYNYDFDNKVFGNAQQSDLGDPSVTYTLDNGLKVGILGCIGEKQISSICTTYVKNIGFKDDADFIKSEATRLKNVEKCDVIIASVHEEQKYLMGNSLEQYVDLVLCGHSHNQEYGLENNRLLYTQNLAYTESCCEIVMTYDVSQKKVTGSTYTFHNGSEIINEVQEVDSTLSSLITNYKNACEEPVDEVLANNVTSNFNTGSLANMLCKAMYEQCVLENHTDVLFTYSNYARRSIYKSVWKYDDVYQSFTFDNEIFIADIKGSEILSEVKNYNYIYRSPTFVDVTEIDPNATYKAAILDYVYLHCNAYTRQYDYFRTTGGTSTTKLSLKYRDVVINYLKRHHHNEGESLTNSSFTGPEYNRSNYTEKNY